MIQNVDSFLNSKIRHIYILKGIKNLNISLGELITRCLHSKSQKSGQKFIYIFKKKPKTL